MNNHCDNKSTTSWSDRKYMRLMSILVAAFFVISVGFGLANQLGLSAQHTTISDMQKIILDVQSNASNTQFENKVANEAAAADPASTANANLEFLSNQTKSHQDFIEQERGFLVYMLSGVFAIGGALICLFGFKSRKDIEETLDKKYAEEIDAKVNSALARALGDNDRLQYLVSAVEKESHAQGKKVCLIRQKNSQELGSVIKWAQAFYSANPDRSVAVIEAPPSLSYALDSDDMYQKCDVIVYEVSPDEFDEKEVKAKQKASGEDFEYKILSDFCKANGKQSILFCSGSINRDIIDIKTTTPAKYPNKVLETLSTLLYL